MDNLKENKIYISTVKWLLIITGTVFVMGLLGYLFIIFGGKLIVDHDQLILDATTTIETTDGDILTELYYENRQPVDIEYIPDHVKDAFIAIEDKRFYNHAGIDPKSVGRAVYRDIISGSKAEGASTITQQLAKNLFLYNDKTWMRKTKETMAAIYLEREFSKDMILEMYLNKIYFGHGVYGIETASQYYFSKSVSKLSIDEGALLAGLAKAPNGYSPIDYPDKSLERRNLVLQVMEQSDMISAETKLIEQRKAISLNVSEREEKPWMTSYIDLVMKEAAEEHELTVEELKRGGYRIIVHVDDSIQKIAYESFKDDTYFPGNTDGVEGAFVMMDEANGEIVAAIGGRDYELGDLNRVTVPRQPGSTMKPIAVYGPAMMKDTFDPYTLIKDEPMSVYPVTNVDHRYDGSISLYESLLKSKNAASVWLLDQIGIDYAKSYLQKLNIDISDNGLAIALGGLSEGVTPLDLMASYRPFVHEGDMIQPHTIERIYNQNNEMIAEPTPGKTEVFSSQVAWNMTEILSSVVEMGTGNVGDYPKALAGKTGSTEHPFVSDMYKDAWFVGYTPRYVSALWMGYDRSDKEHYLTSGSAFPTELTKHILSEMDKQDALAQQFIKPDDVKGLPQPITLPTITDVDVQYVFGGFSIVKGKIAWADSAQQDDNRVVYRIYRQKEGDDELIGEVTGKSEYIIDDVSIFKSHSYYVVPYNPLTNVEGEQSPTVELSM